MMWVAGSRLWILGSKSTYITYSLGNYGGVGCNNEKAD